MKTKKKKWSAEVTQKSDAMDLKKDVFKKSSAQKIAKSVLDSAKQSNRRKSPPKQSAMSMLSFYENRAGKNLVPTQRKKIDQAKKALRNMTK